MNRKALIGVVLFLAAGCGGAEPLSLWRASVIPGEKPASCYPNNTLPPERETVTTNAQEDIGLLEMYGGPEDKLFLDMGSVVYEGKLEEDTYTFSRVETEVMKNQPNATPFTDTRTQTTTITFTIDGDKLDGTATEAETYSCEGAGCPTNYATTYINCTVTHTLKATKVEAENRIDL